MSDCKRVVDGIVDLLRRQSFDELQGMPACKEEPTLPKFSIAVWKDMVSEQEVRIVVQGYTPFFLGLGRMYANGFRIKKAGEILPLTNDDLIDFS
ncbi:MAG: hypothetical protein HGA80_08095 [Candidatus Omnitrophica bacterium]|nr:hypothetical protein [Candidatus Omnitrophota bacterium]